MVSGILQDRVKKCEILSSLASDHSPIVISLVGNNDNFENGPNYWKFNSSLLKNEVFCNGLNEKIEEQKNEYRDFDAQMKWELI